MKQVQDKVSFSLVIAFCAAGIVGMIRAEWFLAALFGGVFLVIALPEGITRVKRWRSAR